MHPLRGYDYTSGRLLQRGYEDGLGAPGEMRYGKDPIGVVRHEDRWFRRKPRASNRVFVEQVLVSDIERLALYSELEHNKSSSFGSIERVTDCWLGPENNSRTNILDRYEKSPRYIDIPKIADNGADVLEYVEQLYLADMADETDWLRSHGISNAKEQHRRVKINSVEDLKEFLKEPFASRDRYSPELNHVYRKPRTAHASETSGSSCSKYVPSDVLRCRWQLNVLRCIHRPIFTIRPKDATVKEFWRDPSYDMRCVFDIRYIDELFEGAPKLHLRNSVSGNTTNEAFFQGVVELASSDGLRVENEHVVSSPDHVYDFGSREEASVLNRVATEALSLAMVDVN